MMKIGNRSINDIIQEMMDSDDSINDMSIKLRNLKIDIHNEIIDYCRNADPMDLGSKLNIPPDDMMEYINLFQKNVDILEMFPILIDIKKPFRDEIERLMLKYIGVAHFES